MDMWVKIVLINKTFVFEPVLLLGLHHGSFGYGKHLNQEVVLEITFLYGRQLVISGKNLVAIWNRNSLWGQVNKIHPKLTVFGYGE